MPFRGFADYDDIDEAIRHTLTREQWAWMSDAQKENLLEDMTMPEPDAEDPP